MGGERKEERVREEEEKERGRSGAIEGERSKGRRKRSTAAFFFRLFFDFCPLSRAELRAPKKQRMPPEARAIQLPSHS